jgi:hypothetical protein
MPRIKMCAGRAGKIACGSSSLVAITGPHIISPYIVVYRPVAKR